jgi:hypothetical protein
MARPPIGTATAAPAVTTVFGAEVEVAAALGVGTGYWYDATERVVGFGADDTA